MSWEQIKDIVNKTGGGGDDYIKLKDGESVIGMFVGEPLTFYQIFKDPTEYPNWQEGRSFKFKTNFAVLQDGKWKIKILQQGKKLLKTVIASIDRYKQDTIYEIKREGADKSNTTYHIFFVEKVTAEQQKAINALDPFKLYLREAKTADKEKELEFPIYQPLGLKGEPQEDENYDAEFKEFRSNIADIVVALVGTSAQDISDFIELSSEWRDNGKIVVKGARDLITLNFVAKPGKTKSQARVLYENIKDVNPEMASKMLAKWREGK